MKLLSDANVSHKLVGALAHEYPGCVHVRDAGLRGAPDQQIWAHVGNAGTIAIADLLRRERQRVEQFANHEETSLLILSIEPAAL